MEYDAEWNRVYLYLQYPVKEGQTKTTVELNENIVLDFDSDGKLLSIEILNASKMLQNKKFMETQSA